MRTIRWAIFQSQTRRVRAERKLVDGQCVRRTRSHARNRLVGQSYRRTLGSTLLRGVSTRLYSSDTEFSFTIGKTGDSIGTGTRVFSEDNATLAGLGFTRSFSDYWTGGFQSWVLRDDETVSDHQSVAGPVTQRAAAEARNKHTSATSSDRAQTTERGPSAGNALLPAAIVAQHPSSMSVSTPGSGLTMLGFTSTRQHRPPQALPRREARPFPKAHHRRLTGPLVSSAKKISRPEGN